MSVAEALAHGTPCIVTRTAPWEGLEREGCGYWVEATPEGLADGISKLMGLAPTERRAMGAQGRQWMAREFEWQKVSARMLGWFSSLVGPPADAPADGRIPEAGPPDPRR